MTYHSLTQEIRNQLVERAQLLSTTIIESTEVIDDFEQMRFYLEEITAKSSGVYGITLATRSPMVIWASSFHPGSDIDKYTQDMLKIINLSDTQGLFGHYYHDNGDLIVVLPLKYTDEIHSEYHLDHMPPGINFPANMTADHIDIYPVDLFDSILYLRFDWQQIKNAAEAVLNRQVLLVSAGTILMLLLSLGMLYLLVLKPIRFIVGVTRQQHKGVENARVEIQSQDEIGQLGLALNNMLDAINDRDRILRSVVDYMPLALILRNIRNKRTLQNKKYLKWFTELSNIQDKEKTNQNFKTSRGMLESEVISSGTEKNIEETVLRDNGDFSYFLTTSFPIYDEKKQVEWVGTISTDITEKKAGEIKLKQLFQAVESARNGILIADAQAKDTPVIYANPAVSRITGFSQEEFMNKNPRFLHKQNEDQNELEIVRNAIRNHSDCKVILRNFKKDGTAFWNEFTLSVIQDKEGTPTHFIGVQDDVTERIEAESKLVQAKEQAESATKIKSQFISNISHEIRTPMNGVIGMAQLLEDTLLTQEQSEYLENIKSSGNTLLGLINNILDFSKLEAGMTRLENIEFDLESICIECIELVEGDVKTNNTEFIFDYDVSCPTLFVGDPHRIKQILINLMSNASKFTAEGFIRLGIKCKHTESEEFDLTIDIEDTGIGLKQEIIGNLFDEFTQADQATTRKYGGSGLGLAITKQLVMLMGGKISVNSVLDKGTIFSISLKLTGKNEPELKKINNLKNIRVLLVEPDPKVQQLYQTKLKSFGVISDVMSDSEPVLEKITESLATETYKILIVSQNLQGGNILKLANEIRSDHQFDHINLLALSSGFTIGDTSKYKRAGFNGVLNKINKLSTLQSMLSMILLSSNNTSFITQYDVQKTAVKPVSNFKKFNAKVLIVEDVIPNQIIAAKFLKRMGVKTEIANNGEEAVSLYESKVYDLIFMDCRMPVMDGYQSTRIIREIEEDRKIKPVPIIALTASASQEDQLACQQAGMNGVITKPFTVKHLSDCLQEWLG